jgi:hypothetical protein
MDVVLMPKSSSKSLPSDAGLLHLGHTYTFSTRDLDFSLTDFPPASSEVVLPCFPFTPSFVFPPRLPIARAAPSFLVLKKKNSNMGCTSLLGTSKFFLIWDVPKNSNKGNTSLRTKPEHVSFFRHIEWFSYSCYHRFRAWIIFLHNV